MFVSSTTISEDDAIVFKKNYVHILPYYIYGILIFSHMLQRGNIL